MKQNAKMKLLELEVEDSIFKIIKDFLYLLPKNKIKVTEIEGYYHIPSVSDNEQKDIEKILKDKNYHVPSRSKLSKL
ncbi:MAG: hypothetical protein FVQ77_04905 [Cytophagales bacterium]|nr:hypothetical protein [Cytophagales bacterium]